MNKGISVIGYGNVGYNLVQLFSVKKVKLNCICTRSAPVEADGVLSKVKVLQDVRDIPKDDMIILCVSDNQIEEVAQQLSGSESLVVHTAGSVSIDVLKNHFENCGVLYPLQTFTKGAKLQNPDFPFFLESSNEAVRKQMEGLVKKMGNPYYFIDSEKRKAMHLAGVMLNNFSNYLFTASEQYLKAVDLPFEVMYPLLHETVDKAKKSGPMNSQTGPAVRKNIETMEKHVSMLEGNPQLQALYRLISENIMTLHAKSY